MPPLPDQSSVTLPPVDRDGVDGPPIGPACRSCGGNDGYGPPPHHAPACYFASWEDAAALDQLRVSEEDQ